MQRVCKESSPIRHSHRDFCFPCILRKWRGRCNILFMYWILQNPLKDNWEKCWKRLTLFLLSYIARNIFLWLRKGDLYFKKEVPVTYHSLTASCGFLLAHLWVVWWHLFRSFAEETFVVFYVLLRGLSGWSYSMVLILR